MKLNLDKVKQIPSRVKKINIRKLNWTTILALLSYFHILVIIPYLASKNKPFVRFHAKQGVVLLGFFALAFFTLYIAAIPYIMVLFYVFCIIFGLINVFRGSERHLPIIGKLADRL